MILNVNSQNIWKRIVGWYLIHDPPSNILCKISQSKRYHQNSQGGFRCYRHEWVNPFMPVEPKNKCPDSNYCNNIVITSAFFERKFKNRYWSELNQHLSLKYFVNVCLIPKLFLYLRSRRHWQEYLWAWMG